MLWFFFQMQIPFHCFLKGADWGCLAPGVMMIIIANIYWAPTVCQAVHQGNLPFKSSILWGRSFIILHIFGWEIQGLERFKSSPSVRLLISEMKVPSVKHLNWVFNAMEQFASDLGREGRGPGGFPVIKWPWHPQWSHGPEGDWRTLSKWNSDILPEGTTEWIISYPVSDLGESRGIVSSVFPLCFFFPPVFNRGPQSCPPCLAAEAHLDPQSLDSWPQGLLSMWSPLLLIWHRSCPFVFGPLFFPSCWDHVNAVLPFLIASVGSYLGSHFSWLIHVNVWQKPLQYCN